MSAKNVKAYRKRIDHISKRTKRIIKFCVIDILHLRL